MTLPSQSHRRHRPRNTVFVSNVLMSQVQVRVFLPGSKVLVARYNDWWLMKIVSPFPPTSDGPSRVHRLVTLLSEFSLLST